MSAVRIEVPGEGVSVMATCPSCKEPLAPVRGWISWRCDSATCATSLIPMWDDARFVDDTGREWIRADDGEWVDVVEDVPA